MSTNAALGASLAVGVTLIGLALLGWQWQERRRRPADLSGEDRAHFRNQDFRRWTVSGLMIASAALMLVGTRVPHLVGRRPNVLFIQTWLAVLGLVFTFFVLALVDWMATGRYARRHRQEITREGMEILRDELRRRAALRRDTRPGASSDQDGDAGS